MQHHRGLASLRHAILTLAAVVPLIGVLGCDRATTARAAITTASSTAVVVVIAASPTVANPATSCARLGVLSPEVRLIVTSAHADVAVDHVTLHLLDGTNVGGPGVTIPQSALTAPFVNGVVRAGTSRTFVLAPTFACGISAPQAIRGDVGVVDTAGVRTLLSTTYLFP